MRTIRDTVEQLYACISFRPGQKPQLEKLRELFYGEGVLINNNGALPEFFTLDSFIQSFKENLTKGVFASLHEHEIFHRSDIFGKIAQCFSTYEFRFDPDTPDPISIGINSIQLIQVEGNWYVTSMAWCDQNERFRIPDQYLG
jgi:hypothetical protein